MRSSGSRLEKAPLALRSTRLKAQRGKRSLIRLGRMGLRSLNAVKLAQRWKSLAPWGLAQPVMFTRW
jgi:hypothetical protein